MKQGFPIKQFDRLVTIKGYSNLANPFDVCNLRLDGTSYFMRYGYTPIASPLNDYKSVYGFGFAYGENTTEFVSVEGAGTPEVIRPYSINSTSFGRTQIGTTTLNGGKWNFASFANYLYAINPNADKLSPPLATVYKHEIGNSSSWSEMQNSNYSAPPIDPVLLINSYPNYDNVQRGFSVNDTVTLYSPWIIQTATLTYNINANKEMEIGGTARNGGTYFDSIFTIDFTANPSGVAEDWSTYGYVGISLKGTYMNDFKQFFNVQVKIGGVWVNVESKAYYGNQSSQSVYDRLFGVIRIKGVAGNNAVQGIRFSITSGGTNDVTSPNWVKIEKIYLRGNFLEAKASSSRIWFPNGSTTPATTGGYNTGIKYGVRFTHSSGTPTPSNADIETITASQAMGTYVMPAYFQTQFSIGGVVALSVSPQNTATYNKVQFLRQMEDGVTWKLLSEQNNTGTDLITVFDTKEEHELASLTTVTVTANTVPPPTPTFRTAGIVGAFPYKQFMFWLVNTTALNLQLSRVGNPEELYDQARAETEYLDEDVTVPQQFTLADNNADRPIWGVQAGQIAFIVGENAAYAMVGDYPRQMSPSRQIPGSRGIAGMYAGTRFRSANGSWSAVYADPDLNIWSVSAVPQFVGDASVQPQELSLAVRGKIKDFLYTSQVPIYGSENLKIEDVHVQFQEETSSLWVTLGKRAAVFRQDNTGNGWELYDYTLWSTGTVSTCTEYFTNNAIAHDYNGGDSTWSNFGYPFASDDSYCLNAFGLPASPSSTTARTTKYLRCHSYLPSPLIPTNAIITNVRWKVEDSKVGDLEVTQTHAHPTVNNVSYGSDLSTNRIVTTSDAEQIYNLASPLPSISDINAGHLGIDLQYTQEVWNSNWNDPANYTVVISPTSPQVYTPATNPPSLSTTYTVTVTYIGAGAKPPRAYVQFNGTTLVGGDVVPVLKQGDTSINIDGNIDAKSGLIGTLPVVPPDLPDPKTISASLSIRLPVTLTSGVGTKTVLMQSSSSIDTAKFQATHTLTATFSPAVTSTVRVDNVAVQVCYTVDSTALSKWSKICFTPNGKYVAIRDTGTIDLVEKDFRNSGVYIGGSNRDGGLVPPSWKFVTQQLQWDGAKARLASVQYHGKSNTDLIDVAVSVDDNNYISGTLEGITTSKWYKFHPSNSSGMRHNIKFEGNESDSDLQGFALEFNVQSRGKPK